MKNPLSLSTLKLAIGIFWMGGGLIASATTYYVATTGSDGNPGTSGSPFLTIQKAASVMVAGDTCEIYGGVYRETVTPAASGTASLPITFTAVSGQNVVVSGANQLTGTWTFYSGMPGSIYYVNTSVPVQQLFCDGAMMNLARWPNANVDQLLAAPRSTVGAGSGSNNALVDPNLPSGNLVGAVAHVFPSSFVGGEYAAYTRTITNYNATTHTLSWSNGWNDGTAFNMYTGNPYYIYNALALLDVPTEWYRDPGTGNLYLWTPDGSSPSGHSIEYKSRSEAFVLDGLSYVNVTGLYIFAAGISMSGSTKCTVNGCTMRYVQHETSADWDNYYVPQMNFVSGLSNVWENSSVTFSSQDGIHVEGTNNTVTNCLIRNVDYYPGQYYAAVNATNGWYMHIENNTLTNAGRFLIYHPAKQIDIGYNYMSNGQQLTKDGGATYAWHNDGQTSNIHNNWAFNSDTGIYLDSSCTNYNVYENVCVGNAEAGIIVNSGGANQNVVNNTVLFSEESFYSDNTSGTVHSNTIIENNLIDGTNLFPTGGSVLSNGWFPSIGVNYVPQAGSGAISNAIPNSFNAGMGSKPDIGAYKSGGSYWTPGANVTVTSFPLPGLAAIPTGLNYAATDTQAFIGWTPSGAATGYNIKRSTVSGGPYTTIGTAGSTASSYLDTGLTANQTYYYVISATDGSGESNNSAQMTVATHSVPSPWVNADIGTVGTAGSGGFLNDLFTINGAGSDIGGNTDGFHYVYQPLAGDGILVSRLTNPGGVPASKTGIMLRESLTAGSSAAMLTLGGYGTRTATNAYMNYQTPSVNLAAPYWLKLVRASNVVSGYVSDDGAEWTQIGTSTTFTMATNIYEGMAVTSRNGAVIDSATFDTVGTLQTPWASLDLGSFPTNRLGYGVYNAEGNFDIYGSGAGIGGSNDTCQFTYKPMNGDGTFIAHQTNNGTFVNTNGIQNGAYSTAQTGIMIRQSASSPAAAAMLLCGTNTLEFITRAASNSWTSVNAIVTNSTPPFTWLKLTRSGTNFSAYGSPDGSTWTQVGTTAGISMTTNTVVGFGVTSKNTNGWSHLIYDHVTGP